MGISYNASICVGCWNGRNPERTVNPDKYDRGELVRCDFCGHHHRSGIYIRRDAAPASEKVPA